MNENAVAFMPWAHMSSPVTIGNVTIAPWRTAKAGESRQSVDRADSLFSCFLNSDGKALDDVAVCQLGGKTFLPVIEQDDIDEIRDAVYALTFLVIAPGIVTAIANNKNFDPPSTADRFRIFPWGLPASGELAYKMGIALHRWRVEDFKYLKPVHVFAGNDSAKKTFVAEIDKIFTLAKGGNDKAEKIIRSLEWFALSQTNSPDVTFSSKLVMLSTAFEILLEFPRGRKSMYFAEEIDKLRSPNGNDVVTAKTLENNSCNFTEKAYWAYDFYKMRNDIVHGQRVHPKDIHFDTPTACKFLNFDLLACVLFNECVARKMDALGVKSLLNQQTFEGAYKMIGWLT